MLISECPICQAVIQPLDRFCEACGNALAVVSTVSCCPRCQAPGDAIDSEGYCGQCGFQVNCSRSREPDDRVELTLGLSLAGISDRGLVHTRNEDAIALASVDGTSILVVCDGVSSSLNPHMASQTAAQTICQVLTATAPSGIHPTSALQRAMAQAQAAVAALAPVKFYDAKHNNARYNGRLDEMTTLLDPPSTTGVAAIVQAGMATIGWLGDSRAYWVPARRADRAAAGQGADHSAAQQLTEDDSWINTQAREGQGAEASEASHAHVITRWLGADAPNSNPSILTVHLRDPGYLILCSDGLWNYLQDAAHLANLLASAMQANANSGAAELAQHLVNYARSQGGYDNITVAIFVASLVA
ncbi:MAG: protein phosphatase 2C domain-containing protein [Synechococcales cyanobacterium M58_A2018_015]|nr:protein phosphatase 2C domain-containing protein [Synechococcales cyanobacterium M58_A2018_015]